MKLTDLLTGTRILEKKGKITVFRDFTFGTYIKVGRLTQSGGVVEKIWRETLKEFLNKKPTVNNVLILGLGGGSAAKIIRQYWVTSKITGIDIDKKIVDFGKKYLGLDKIDLNIQIEDAYKFVENDKGTYDLILVDLYNGDKFPEEFEAEKFIKMAKARLDNNGIIIFNRLIKSENFGEVLENYFKRVDYKRPIANIMFVCYN